MTTSRQVIGAMLIGLPFIAVCVVGVHMVGIRGMLTVFAILAGMGLCFGLGLWLWGVKP